MKPVRLYIENFMCHENSFIDFTKFNTALIVGKVENNDLYSNGVGKTTIFKAIEYVLFNQADVNLEKIIRDNTDSCSVVLDFLIGEQEYRIVRKRTKKSTDFSLLERTSLLGDEEEVYHKITEVNDNKYYFPFINEKENEISFKKYWKDVSGSRASDTEKDLDKLIKINYKSFRNIIHFIQNDFSGLATSTPEKRKLMFKDSLNLVVYSKLEKIAKEKFNLLVKDIDKYKLILETLGNPSQELILFDNQILSLKNLLLSKNEALDKEKNLLNETNFKINTLTSDLSNLESKFIDLLNKEQNLQSEKNRNEISVKEYTSKKANAIKSAKELIDEVKLLKITQGSLNKIDYSQIDILLESIANKKDQITRCSIIIQNDTLKYEELKIPVPNDSVCKHCRQEMTNIHRKECQKQIDLDIINCQESIKKAKKEIVVFNKEIQLFQENINSLTLSKKQLEDVDIKISSKNKEIQDKKSLHDEYDLLLNKFIRELSIKDRELEQVREDLKKSSLEEANNIKFQISDFKKNIDVINNSLFSLNKEITHISNSIAVIQHNIDQKTKDVQKEKESSKLLSDLEIKSSMYPSVIQSFSTLGIPNLIIQNVLDDLQIEANNLLSQLKPGLQLSFFVEKTRGDGIEADTLDINYYINGKERYYEQLSGAMKLAVTFSLKLGLSFLLQKMVGVDIKLLLLDEIDQSLDKASVDAFADIIKFFQKDFTILVITHNDRLKDKFSHAILVDQDTSMVSRAKVVSIW